MRGDSIRDLYAKTLALLGLGVLAGAGALVDYWPVGVSVPPVTAALGQPLPAGPLSVDAVGVPPAPVIPAAGPTRLPRAAVAHVSPPASFAPPSLPIAPAGPAGVGRAVDLGLLGVEPQATLARAASPEDVVFDGRLLVDAGLVAAADPLAGVPTSRFVPASAMSRADGGGDGLITGAVKRTGSSIVKTGLKTGTSIFDAMRVVSDVVRRALPTD